MPGKALSTEIPVLLRIYCRIHVKDFGYTISITSSPIPPMVSPNVVMPAVATGSCSVSLSDGKTSHSKIPHDVVLSQWCAQKFPLPDWQVILEPEPQHKPTEGLLNQRRFIPPGVRGCELFYQNKWSLKGQSFPASEHTLVSWSCLPTEHALC